VSGSCELCAAHTVLCAVHAVCAVCAVCAVGAVCAVHVVGTVHAVCAVCAVCVSAAWRPAVEVCWRKYFADKPLVSCLHTLPPPASNKPPAVPPAA
jgi:hypothetical protein